MSELINVKIAKVPKGTARGAGGGASSVIRYGSDGKYAEYAARAGYAQHAGDADHAAKADAATIAERLSEAAMTILDGRFADLSNTVGSFSNAIEALTIFKTLISDLFTPYSGTVAKTWSNISKSSDYDSIKVAGGVWTDSFVSAHGLNANAGTGTGGGSSTLAGLNDVTITSPTNGSVLIYNGTEWVNGRILVPSLAGYAQESWVSANYLDVNGNNATDATLPHLVDKLFEGSGDRPYDGDYIIATEEQSQHEYAYKWTMLQMWNYMKSKADSVYQPKGTSGTGGTVDLSAYLKADGSNGTAKTLQNLTHKLPSDTSKAIVDGDYFPVASAAQSELEEMLLGGAHKRTASELWSYIKSKADTAYLAADGSNGDAALVSTLMSAVRESTDSLTENPLMYFKGSSGDTLRPITVVWDYIRGALGAPSLDIGDIVGVNNIMPLGNNAQDIGRSAKAFKALYVNEIHSGNLPTPLKMSCGSNSNQLMLYYNGNVGVKTSANTMPSYTLEVNGTFYASSITSPSITQSSDATLKTVLGDLDIDIHAIADAPAVRFEWKDTGIEDYGTLAQYWQTVNPLFTTELPDGTLGLSYGKLGLVCATTTAKVTVDNTQRIDLLEQEIAALKDEINTLKEMLKTK